jgi:DNA-binding Xre family transcriptional regulator
MDKRFNPTRFRALITKKIQDKGYRSIHAFTEQNKNNFHRNPLSRALNGIAVPNRETINAWCKALDCSPAETSEIVSSIYVDEEESVAA